jgi:hypothetical protein
MRLFEPKVAENFQWKFFCNFCNYGCCKKADFNKHLLTRKHNSNRIRTEKSQLVLCGGCGKEFKSKSGLWYHKKRCNGDKKIIGNVDNDLVKMMGDAMQHIKKQSDQIDELIPKVGNNNNNTQFNLNIFLKEECKDAIDWNEFLKSIELDVEDLKKLKNSNLTMGISDAICNKISELGVYNRPIHCYDQKRKKLCIKTNSDWEKEEDKVDKLIEKGDKELQHKYISLISKWEEEHPNWMDNEGEMEEYVELQNKIYDGIDDKKNKIILVKELNIPK